MLASGRGEGCEELPGQPEDGDGATIFLREGHPRLRVDQRARQGEEARPQFGDVALDLEAAPACGQRGDGTQKP